jgi:hypothetical protein
MQGTCSVHANSTNHNKERQKIVYLYNYLARILAEQGAPKSCEEGLMTEPPSGEWIDRRTSDLDPTDVIVGMASCVRCPGEKALIDITIGMLFRWKNQVERYNAVASARGNKFRSLAVRPVCTPCRKSRKQRRTADLKEETSRKLLKAAVSSPEALNNNLTELRCE